MNKWLLSVLCFVLAGAGAYVASRTKAETPKAGSAFPQTPAELNAWYVEPAENAAMFYLRGCDALRVATNLPYFGSGKLPPLGTRLPATLISALGLMVKSNSKALELFSEGARREQSRYPVDLSLGIDTPSPHLPRLKKAAQFLQLAAIWHAEANQPKQAADDILAALGVARSLETEPALLSQFVRSGIISTAIGALERILNRATLPQNSLDELGQALKRMEEFDARGESFNRALIAESVNSLALLSAPEKLAQVLNAPGTKVSPEERTEIKASQVKEAQKFLAATMDGLMSPRQEPFPGRLKADGYIAEAAERAREKNLGPIAVLLRGLKGPTASEAACLAHIRVGVAAVALEQFRAGSHKQYPAALSEATADYPDPFDGQPLRYRKTGSGYALYSIGSDLKDNSADRNTDIVFSVPAAPAAAALTASRR